MGIAEEIRSRIDIVDFIGSYISLKRTGKNYRGFCPFHQEKHPSFFVSPEKGLWHCFSCQRGGDVIKFLMLYENISFQEAIKILAEKAGLDVSKYHSVDEKAVEILYSISNKAWQYFKENLGKNKEAMDYFMGRGLKKEIIKEFGLGYSPESGLVNYLLKAGFKAEDIAKAGLASKFSGKYYDFFRNRLMFPILNHFGKVVAFSGRVFKEGENEGGKYINSPASLIYNKSKILYGFYKSKSEINKTKEVIIVEGYMDFLLSYQTGIKNIVATSGTALTADQIKILRRFASKIILCFDNDQAGVFALERQIENLLSFGFEISAVDLSPFKDPGEIAQENPSLLLEKFSNSKPVFEILFNFYLNQDKDKSDWPSKKRNIIHLLEIIKKIDQPLEQSHWLGKLAQKAGIKEDVIIKQFSLLKSEKEHFQPPEIIEKPKRQDLICQRIFSLAFFDPHYLEELKKNEEIIPNDWKKFIASEKTEEIKKQIDELEMAGQYEFSSFNSEDIDKEFKNLMSELKIDFLKNKSYKIKERIKNNPSSPDIEKNLKEFQSIHREIEKLKYEKEKRF